MGWIVVVSLQVGAGLGQHEAALTSEQIVRFQQVGEQAEAAPSTELIGSI